MRLVRFGQGQLGVVVGDDGDTVLDVKASLAALAAVDADGAAALRAVLPDHSASWVAMIRRWDDVKGALQTIAERAAAGESGFVTIPLAEVALQPPTPDPAVRIFALGGNFPVHLKDAVSGMVKEMPASISKPKEEQVPWGFTVLPGTLAPAGADVSPPAGVQKLDYEAEVGVVLRGPVEPGNPASVRLWGYMAVNDFSIRDHVMGLSIEDHGPMQFGLTKNFDTGNACGPWLVVVDGEAAVRDLTIECRINGELRQHASTAEMMWGFDEVAAHVSKYMRLDAGDMVFSGTPGGTAVESGIDGPYLQDGDVAEVEVTGAGVLRNRVVFKR